MKIQLIKPLLGASAFAAMMFSAAPQAKAIAYDLNYEFSGAQAPAGLSPWVQVVITDSGVGSVTLQFNNVGLTSNENVSWAGVNLADTYRGALLFSPVTKVGVFDAPTISQQTGSQTSDPGTYKADGDGYFDVALSFTDGAGNPNGVFGVGESATFTITSTVGGLDASDFDLTSYTGGGNGVWHAAAHVQNTTGLGAGGSGWIGDTTVPDGGTTIALLGSAMLGAGFLRRRFGKA
jgi:hypothetical protein